MKIHINVSFGKITNGDNLSVQAMVHNTPITSSASLQPYGLASGTPIGSPAIVLNCDDNKQVLIAGSKDDAPKAEIGEIIIYAEGGQKITLDPQGNIAITGAGLVTIDGQEILKVGDNVQIPVITADTINGFANGVIMKTG